MDKIFKRYAWVGFLTFIPILISGYYMLDVFGEFWDAFVRRNYPAEFDINNNRDQEMIFGGIFFSLAFFTYFTGISSSILYIYSFFKKKEKWLFWGHRLRIATWIPVILGGLFLLGAFSMIVIRET